MRDIRFMPLLALLSLLGLSSSSALFAAQGEADVRYIEIDPVIVTNYLRAKGKKPGFVQLQAQITVRGKAAEDMIEKHTFLEVREIRTCSLYICLKFTWLELFCWFY